MCYRHYGPQPYGRTLVRGLWRLVILSGLLWLLFPSADARAQDVVPAASHVAPAE